MNDNVVPLPTQEAPFFTLVNPEYLHDVWSWVRPRLERVIEKNEETGWLPEDVYAAIKSGSATLATIGEDDGIVVLQRQVRHLGPVLFVWVLEGDNLMPQWQRILDELRRIARVAGAKKIVQHSGRRYEKFGFTPTRTIYEMEV